MASTFYELNRRVRNGVLASCQKIVGTVQSWHNVRRGAKSAGFGPESDVKIRYYFSKNMPKMLSESKPKPF